MMAQAREASRAEGYRLGVETGRREAVEALAKRGVEARPGPFERQSREPEFEELEAC